MTIKKQRGTVIAFDSRRTTRTLVHREKPIACKLYAFPLKRGKNRRPGINGNAFAFPPLLNPSARDIQIDRHRGERVPTVKNVVQGSHALQHAPDDLSGQEPPMIPMTVSAPARTISPMGRATTPVQFRAAMAKRLMSARIMAGFETKKQAADALQIGLDRYEKWESGRTPVPAQYVGAICELFNIDANYLFGVAQPVAQRRVSSG
jgi:hypothetical protein